MTMHDALRSRVCLPIIALPPDTKPMSLNSTWIMLAIKKCRPLQIAIDCSDKTVRGWPFRMTLVCESIDVGAQDFQVAANGLRAVAMVYNPSHLIVEADSPVEIAGTQLSGPVTAQWKSGRASLQLSQNIVDRASFVFSDLALDSTTFLPLANPTADTVEVHLRRSEQPQDLDVAIMSRTVASYFGTAALPEFDLDVLATITDGAHFLVSQSKRFKIGSGLTAGFST